MNSSNSSNSDHDQIKFSTNAGTAVSDGAPRAHVIEEKCWCGNLCQENNKLNKLFNKLNFLLNPCMHIGIPSACIAKPIQSICS